MAKLLGGQKSIELDTTPSLKGQMTLVAACDIMVGIEMAFVLVRLDIYYFNNSMLEIYQRTIQAFSTPESDQ